ncbi:hypothetical protein Ac2012v2_003876 [Leucoagaricus gongylophorus]
MSLKGSSDNAPSSTIRVKQEPIETRTPLGSSNSFGPGSPGKEPVRVKAELDELVAKYLDSTYSSGANVKNEEMKQSPQSAVPSRRASPLNHTVPAPLFKEHKSAEEIAYSPEAALEEGVKMIQTLKARMQNLKLGSKLREEVWAREISSLENQGTPTTLIAVCGATGAGKSSILNAILDDNVVPTSGMRACTAVVTEIGYHNKSTIDADVTFLSLAEWKSELTVLLHDMVDEDGNLKRSTDLKSDAGIAWSKMNAVYPFIAQEDLVNMSADQIIARDHNIANILGTTKRISAKDSRTFAKEIAKYIDSKDQKRGKKDRKENEKEKEKGPSLMAVVRAKTAQHPRNTEKPKTSPSDDEPALWPLIRQVNVRCKAAALSTGAVLVDLPGVADANAARNNVAKDYMKKAGCIWILAPITRAVDDKTARDLLGDAFRLQLLTIYHSTDGNYDDHTITFIASKCDDISCSEVVRALGIHDEPELEEIETRIENIENEMSVWKQTEAEAQKHVKAINQELELIREIVKEHEEHLEAFENNQPFVPRLTGKSSAQASKKRKRNGKDELGSFKRRKIAADSDDDNDDFSISDDDSEINSDSNNSDSESGDESDHEGNLEQEAEELVTEDGLKAKIKDGKEKIKEIRSTLTGAREKKKDASDKIARLKKSLAKVQRDKNAFCSLKRSEFSRDVLREDFRTGLKDLDDAAAEERDPENFDPTVNLRGNILAFVPSYHRDYIRIKGQVKGDGEPTCFTNPEDTGIPALQQWCHQLTIASRERSARNFFTQLRTFVTSVESYIHGITDVTVADREFLRQRWESNDIYGQTVDMKGVALQLAQRFANLVDDCVENIKAHFKDGLEEKCRVGAANASDAAVQTTDEFSSSMHWATYRATLRRHGEWKRNFNEELTLPFTRNIASSWGKVFETDLVGPFGTDVKSAVNKLLTEIEDTAAPGLKDRIKIQGEMSLAQASETLRAVMDLVRNTLSTQQKEVSRCMSPHVRSQLIDGYNQAMEERGTGSVARQKAVFHDYVADHKDDIFESGADVILEQLDSIANAVGGQLENALEELSKQVEVNVSILWEDVQDGPDQIRARQDVLECASMVIRQVELWTAATESTN